MSRTVRRRDGQGWCYGHRDLKWVLEEHHYECIYSEDRKWYRWVSWDEQIDPKSKEGKKRIARFHSDAQSWGNGNGPNWWIREFVQRPYRREAKREIQKAMIDDDYEVIIRDKPKRPYWD